MKRFIAIALVSLLTLALCSCETQGEEIGRADFNLDKNKVLEQGFSDFKKFLNGVYNNPDDVKEMAGNNVEPIVQFDDAIYLQMGDYKFTTRMLYYALAELKTNEINESTQYYINAQDNDEYWNSLVFDKYSTRKEVVLEAAKNHITNLMVTMGIMKEYGFSESDNYIYSYENILSNYGSKQAIDNYYGAYGLTADGFKTYLRYVCAYNEFKEYLIGPQGPLFPSDEETKKYFYQKCMFYEQIVFNYTTVNDNGYIVYKTSDEIEAVRKRGKKLFSEIEEAPEMFDRNMHLTEHDLWTDNPAGYCYCPGEVMVEIEEAYFKLKPGEVAAIDSPIGYYIIRAKAKTDDVYDANNSIIKETYCNELYEKEMERYYDRLIINEEQFNRYDYLDILLFKN